MPNLDSVHPWQPSVDEFKANTLPILEKHGKSIGKAASNGDQKAKEVIRVYTMLHRSFDPMTYLRLIDAITAYDSSLL